MKLLVVSTWYPWPPDNGAKMRAWGLLRELARHHRVSLVSFSDGGPIDASRLARLEACCHSVDVVPRTAFHGGPASRARLFSATPRAYAQAFSPAMKALVRRALPGHDVAVALGLWAVPYLADETAVPVVFEEAELAIVRDEYLSAPGVLRRLRRGLTWWKYSRFVRRLCGRAAQTTVASEQERTILRSIGCDASRVTVVPNAVDAEDLDWPRPSAPAPRLIYAGSPTYAPNLDAVTWFAASALPIIQRSRPSTGFWVTGRADERAAACERESGVMFTGYLPDVRAAIAESAVCVVPLRIGGGTRLKILQAMALGTPVVSTTKGAEGLDVTPGHDILIGDTADELAAHVLRLLDDPALATRLAHAARELVRTQYTWARSGATLNGVIGAANAAFKAVHP
jgi:glycosyltransferase involved in cell wall biosynthesis